MIRWLTFWCTLPFAILVNVRDALRFRRWLMREARRYKTDGGFVADRNGRRITMPLRRAFAWTCEVCGRDNYATVVYRDVTDRQAVALARLHGIIDDEDDIEAVPEEIRKASAATVPAFVRCSSCGCAFETECPCGCGGKSSEACSDD